MAAPPPRAPSGRRPRSSSRRRPRGGSRAAPRRTAIELVVQDVCLPLPVHVVRADELVRPVGQLVAVAVADLRSVSGEVEDDDVTGLRPLERRLQPSKDVFLRRALIHDDAYVLVVDPEDVLQRPPNECDIVDAAVQGRDVGSLYLSTPTKTALIVATRIPSVRRWSELSHLGGAASTDFVLLDTHSVPGYPIGTCLVIAAGSTTPPASDSAAPAARGCRARRNSGMRRSARSSRRSSATSWIQPGRRRISIEKPSTVCSPPTSTAFGGEPTRLGGTRANPSVTRSAGSSELLARTATTLAGRSRSAGSLEWIATATRVTWKPSSTSGLAWLPGRRSWRLAPSPEPARHGAGRRHELGVPNSGRSAR